VLSAGGSKEMRPPRLGEGVLKGERARIDSDRAVAIYSALYSRFDCQTKTLLSAPPDANDSPFYANFTAWAGRSWPYKVYIVYPCLRSNTFSVLSFDPESKYVPLL
jgi:hypothetical protein